MHQSHIAEKNDHHDAKQKIATHNCVNNINNKYIDSIEFFDEFVNLF